MTSPTSGACFGALAVGGAGLVAAGVARNWGTYDSLGLLLVCGAALAWSLALARRPAFDPGFGSRAACLVAWLVALGGVLIALVQPPGMYVTPHTPALPLLLMYGVAAAAIGSFLGEALGGPPPPPGVARARVALLFVAALGLGAWMIAASPEPRIDVWHVQQDGARLLLAGERVYGDMMRVLDTHTDGHVYRSYPYPPLNLLLTAPAHALAGDVRWASLAAVLAGAALIRVLAAARAARGSPWPDLLAACVLLHPRGLFVIEQAWTEPLALPFLAAVPLLVASGRTTLAAVALGLLLAQKHYYVLLLPFGLLLPGLGARGAAIALGTVAATVAPFALREPADTWHTLVAAFGDHPFRPDSLSLSGFLAGHGFRTPAWVGYVAAAALVWASVRLRARAGASLLAAALACAAVFGLGRQAFANYYWLIGATAIVAAALAGPDGQADARADHGFRSPP